MKTTFSLLPLLLALGLSGCQSLPAPDAPPPADAGPPAKHYAPFSQDSLYALLSAELAGQRNRFDIALHNYVQQARITRDPGVAERAFRIAEYLGAEAEALDTALIWSQSAPHSLDAQRASAIQLARAGRYQEALQHMEQVLLGEGDTQFDFLALAAMETDSATRDGLLKSFEHLLQRHPENGQLLFGKALLLQQDGRSRAALRLLEAHPASSREIPPLLLRSRLLQSLERGEEALPLLERGIRLHPDDKRLRLAYARQLVELQQLDQARSEFAGLLQRFPDDDDLRYSLALISIESQDWPGARLQLQDLILRDAHVDAARFNLGRIAEELGDLEQARQQYQHVSPGDDYLAARARLYELRYAEDPQAARQLLADSREQQPGYAIALYLIEIEGLTNQQHSDQAWQLIGQALQQFPDNSSLLYTRAMLAEKRGDLAGLEHDLRTILSLEPDNAAALNALGYTLADRTTRYSEALQLIEHAHRLNPDDPATLDSLGWVNYRLGRLEQAEDYLRQALARMPDHEVAAHLGEVLWVTGRRSEARSIWREALKEAPDSPVLRDTLQRLTGSDTP